MSFTQRTSAAVLNYVFGNTSDFDTQPTIHVALSTTAPNETGGNVTEPVGNGYARVAAAAAVWNNATDADPSVIDNGTAITLGPPTGSWGTVTHFVIYDAITGGNVVASGALTASRAIDNGDTVTFQIGELNITLD